MLSDAFPGDPQSGHARVHLLGRWGETRNLSAQNRWRERGPSSVVAVAPVFQMLLSMAETRLSTAISSPFGIVKPPSLKSP